MKRQVVQLIAWFLNVIGHILYYLLRPFFGKRLKDWKPIHLCQWFGSYGVNAPKYFIGMVNAPTVSTSDCTSVSYTSATGNGNITNTGGENCTRRGFCYMTGTSGDPTTANSVAYDDGSFGTGEFTKSITGLSAGTNYRVRAYAVNSAGTGYGTTVQLTTSSNTPPTVALNSPTDTQTITDTTPELTFTGTDSQSDTIRYNVQVDSANTFNSQAGTPSVCDSYSESNKDGQFNPLYYDIEFGSGYPEQGQSFTGNGYTLNSCKFYLKKSSGATGSAYAKVYAHSGTFGTSSVATGSALATSNAFDVSTLDASVFGLASFVFSGANRITLTNSTKYVVVVSYYSTTSYLYMGIDQSSPSHGGNFTAFSSDTSLWYSFDQYDACFYLYTDAGVPLIDAVSGTDAGFTDKTDGTDLDPFDSGDQIGYQTQSALSAGTYYWRVRGIDPTGSNTYGAWSSTYSFTISEASTGTTRGNYVYMIVSNA